MHFFLAASAACAAFISSASSLAIAGQENLVARGSPAGWSYYGCVELPPFAEISLIDEGDMTRQLCASYCQNKNYEVAGLSEGSDCYCWHGSNNKFSTLDETKCNLACTGDAQDTCGGHKSLSILNNANQSSPKELRSRPARKRKCGGEKYPVSSSSSSSSSVFTSSPVPSVTITTTTSSSSTPSTSSSMIITTASSDPESTSSDSSETSSSDTASTTSSALTSSGTVSDVFTSTSSADQTTSEISSTTSSEATTSETSSTSSSEVLTASEATATTSSSSVSETSSSDAATTSSSSVSDTTSSDITTSTSSSTTLSEVTTTSSSSVSETSTSDATTSASSITTSSEVMTTSSSSVSEIITSDTMTSIPSTTTSETTTSATVTGPCATITGAFVLLGSGTGDFAVDGNFVQLQNLFGSGYRASFSAARQNAQQFRFNGDCTLSTSDGGLLAMIGSTTNLHYQYFFPSVQDATALINVNWEVDVCKMNADTTLTCTAMEQSIFQVTPGDPLLEIGDQLYGEQVTINLIPVLNVSV
ncbi:hypothetical protein PFICI_14935 [Pestalotiopsis fici W106-1]|uniref:WSC domain-containing protein n=1 Tax=Pestalotiopsis fici (strain W106-1 / CGMCC3.15140) TaxID=1229662 RepID=W3WHD9_PESFW|nr:uncharacterized protein PFICI_14935 [Pestalotiopsis fici W106-1]ETS73330.1 hypothetical protein PFICI_14935 [Pestalotiopsis fici W106-1]